MLHKDTPDTPALFRFHATPFPLTGETGHHGPPNPGALYWPDAPTPPGTGSPGCKAHT